mgnify:CR=1 FL=1
MFGRTVFVRSGIVNASTTIFSLHSFDAAVSGTCWSTDIGKASSEVYSYVFWTPDNSRPLSLRPSLVGFSLRCLAIE